MFSAAQALVLAYTSEIDNKQYEALTINQERLKLSNLTSQKSTELANLDIPTPPRTADFTQVNYTFTMGDSIMEIANVRPNGGAYNVTATTSLVDDYMQEGMRYHVVNNGNGQYQIGTTTLVRLSDLDIDDTEMQGYINAIRNTFPEYQDEVAHPSASIPNEFYVYVDSSSAARRSYQFMFATDVQGVSENNNAAYVQSYRYISNGLHEETFEFTDCKLEFDTSGRITSIWIPSYSDDTSHQIIGHTQYPMNSTTVTDNAAYEDAFNKYKYSQYVYEQKQQEIEASIKELQVKDKKLELKLKEIEDRVAALQKMVESANKVIDDSIESGFKGFA